MGLLVQDAQTGQLALMKAIEAWKSESSFPLHRTCVVFDRHDSVTEGLCAGVRLAVGGFQEKLGCVGGLRAVW